MEETPQPASEEPPMTDICKSLEPTVKQKDPLGGPYPPIPVFTEEELAPTIWEVKKAKFLIGRLEGQDGRGKGLIPRPRPTSPTKNTRRTDMEVFKEEKEEEADINTKVYYRKGEVIEVSPVDDTSTSRGTLTLQQKDSGDLKWEPEKENYPDDLYEEPSCEQLDIPGTSKETKWDTSESNLHKLTGRRLLTCRKSTEFQQSSSSDDDGST